MPSPSFNQHITVHMDAINHMTVTRQHMRDYVKMNQLEQQVHIPNDGDTIKLYIHNIKLKGGNRILVHSVTTLFISKIS